MGCNCKGKKSPTGFGQVAPNTRDAQRQMREAAERAAREQAQTKREPPADGTQTFTLRTADGRVQTFRTALEARAARARHGGGTISF